MDCFNVLRIAAVSLLLIHVSGVGSQIFTPSFPCDQYTYFIDAELDATGVLESYNYPFNFANTDPCMHRYTLQKTEDTRDQDAWICFTFRRFNVWNSMVTFGEADYDDAGFLRSNDDKDKLPPSVWVDNFCWSFTEIFEIKIEQPERLDSQMQLWRASGFYADYTISYTEPPPPDPATEYPCDKSEHDDDKSEDHDDTSWFKCFDNEHNPQCVDSEETCYVPGESPFDNHCTDESDKSYMHARCQFPEPPGRAKDGSITCDFTFCNPYKRKGWVIEDKSLDQFYGPNNDHTQIFNDGLLSGAYSNNMYTRSNFVRLVNPQLSFDLGYPEWDENQDLCVSFWYMMYGRDVGRLSVAIIDYGPPDDYIGLPDLPDDYEIDSPLWSRESGALQQTWARGQLQLQLNYEEAAMADSLKLLFTATFTDSRRSRISLDDISVIPGQCNTQDDISCNFERDFCDWMDMLPTDKPGTKWTRTSGPQEGSDLLGDYSSINGTGHYLISKEPNVNLVSPRHGNNYGPHCLVFWYYIEDTATLAVHAWNHTADMPILEDEFLTHGENWTRAMVDVKPHDDPRRIEIRIRENTDFVALDGLHWYDLQCADVYVSKCPEDMFQCDSGDCVYGQCDGEADCDDKSDEVPGVGCPDECTDDEYMCPTLKFCIKRSYICNGVNDCSDYSDEYNCASGLAIKPVLLVAVVIGTISVFALVVALVTMFIYKRRYKRQQRYREQMLQAIQDNVQPLPQEPPEYWDTVQGGGTQGTLRVPPPYDVSPPTYEADRDLQTTEGAEYCGIDDPIPYDEISLAGNRVTEGSQRLRHRAGDSGNPRRPEMPDVIPVNRQRPASNNSMNADNGSAVGGDTNEQPKAPIPQSEHDKERIAIEPEGGTDDLVAPPCDKTVLSNSVLVAEAAPHQRKKDNDSTSAVDIKDNMDSVVYDNLAFEGDGEDVSHPSRNTSRPT